MYLLGCLEEKLKVWPWILLQKFTNPENPNKKRPVS